MKVIKTDKSPLAIGTYSQATKVGKFIFTSGQIGINPETGLLVTGGIKFEIEQTLNNLENILLEGGSSLKKLVKINVYLTNLSNFNILNKIFKKRLNNEKLPARTTIEVSGLPKMANVEIDAIGSTE